MHWIKSSFSAVPGDVRCVRLANERLVNILSKLSTEYARGSVSRGLCEVSVLVTAMSGAGIMFVPGDLPGGSLCSSNQVSKFIEDLQYTLGEGPCVDAHRSGQVVHEPDLDAPDRSRWQGFAPPAIQAGVRAVFGFPLRVGVVRLGALNLYRDQPGPLADDQYCNALVMADVAARAILALQSDALPGGIAAELDTDGILRHVVHQAAGMISIQLDITVSDALVRLRSRAFGTNRLVTDVAEDVVSRRVRFDDTGL